MTLRARLVLASVVILAVVALGAVLLEHTQHDFLIAQVDDQLGAARPFVRFRPPDDAGPRPTGEGTGTGAPPDTPISNLYVGAVEDGELVTLLEGRLLDDEPSIPLDDESLAAVADGEPFTAPGTTTSTRFRVAVIRFGSTGAYRVIALPLDEAERTITRLRWELGGGIAVIAGVLVVVVWWVERLGLRPVARLTKAAERIAAGERDHRVSPALAGRRTEAGKLAAAFNVMLDERDAGEERLRQFVADASHELRTPLTSIRGYLDLYQEGGFRDDGALDDVVRRMSRESRRMQELVEDLLLLAKLDQHRPLREERVDLAALVQDAATDARVVQPDRDISVSVPARPVEVLGDAFRLQQVVGALVNNALVHTRPEVSVSLSARSVAGGGAVVTVADTGPGLGPEDAGRVFDRFYRGDPSRGRRTGGSGLGLSISKSIVEAHGGTIALETAVGTGCRFTVSLPG